MQWFKKLLRLGGTDDWRRGSGGAAPACAGEPSARALVERSLPEKALWSVERWVERNGISLATAS